MERLLGRKIMSRYSILRNQPIKRGQRAKGSVTPSYRLRNGIVVKEIWRDTVTQYPGDVIKVSVVSVPNEYKQRMPIFDTEDSDKWKVGQDRILRECGSSYGPEYEIVEKL